MIAASPGIGWKPASSSMVRKTRVFSRRRPTSDGSSPQQLDRPQGAARDGRRERVREELGPRTLREQLAHLAARCDVAARGAAESLAESARHDVDGTEQAEVLGGATAGLPEDADGV